MRGNEGPATTTAAPRSRRPGPRDSARQVVDGVRATATRRGDRTPAANIVTLPTGSLPERELDTVDEVAAFRPAILGIRGGTTAISMVLAAGAVTSGNLWIALWTFAVLGYNVFRMVRPVRIHADTASLVRVIVEVGIHVLAVVATGYWASPFVFSLLTTIMVAGFARGFGFAVRIGAASALAVAIPDLLPRGPGDAISAADARISLQWTSELLLVALIAGYARRVTREADRQHSLALDRLGRLSDANALLFALHRVAQSLPASLGLDEVLDTTMGRIGDLFRFDAAAVMVLDDTGGGWIVARSEGRRFPRRIAGDALPHALQRAVDLGGLVNEPDLARSGGPGLTPESRSGIYAALIGREATVGIVAVEHTSDHHFDDRDVELLRGFVAPAALAVDNALWFSRLRTLGADEERTRIARDLHDRIGQSLAYVAFELDRIVKSDGRGERVTVSLERLRGDVRGVIGEVRDTLYDLRTDVSEARDLPATLKDFLDRVEGRSDVRVRLDVKASVRLPVPQEREILRIAQEAVTNVERHSGAERCLVRWWCDRSMAVLEVHDDGAGFHAGRAGRLDSYGILGMRERATSIGATLELDSAPGTGAVVRCLLRVAETG